ncbi:MAG TPA: hypothetical protein VFG30_02920 [Polyangiales bacterium]|nr:hypothetical protein [Polyangiales bacterium]
MGPSPPAQPATSVEVLGQAPGYLVSAHHNVLIACWTAQGTAPMVEAFGHILDAFIAQHAEGISTVHLISAGLPLATGGARDVLTALMKKHGHAVACVGTVLEGTGFWASATRSLILGLQLVAPNSVAMRTYASVTEIATWLPKPHAQRTGIVIEPQELEQSVTIARAQAVTAG